MADPDYAPPDVYSPLHGAAWFQTMAHPPARTRWSRGEVSFVGMPAPVDEPGTVWLEAALDGVLAFDRDDRITRHLSCVRRDIADGRLVRRREHGQPYWTATR